MNIDYLKKYSKIIVIGHKNPDTDTIISSYVLANVLKQNGINAYYGVLEGEKPSDACMKLINDAIKYNPMVIKKEDVNKYHYFLVDHNDVNQSIMNISLVVGVIDHHPNSMQYKDAIFTKYCSTTLAIYDLFKDKYDFSKNELKALYIGLIDDSSFGRNSRYKDIDHELVKEMGFNDDVSIYFEKYFTETNLDNLMYAFQNNGLKKYNFDGIKFESTYIERLDTNKKDEYKSFVKNNQNNFLGMWLDFKNNQTYAYLNYDGEFKEKTYNFIAARSTNVLNDTLDYIRSKK